MQTAGWLVPFLGIFTIGSAWADDKGEATGPPPAFAPFESLVGGWKGQGIPAKNRLKGWPEKHAWAWKFAKGRPVGMGVELTGNKVLRKADLLAGTTPGAYRLEGTDAEGKPVKYSGQLDETTGVLSLEREDPPAGLDAERIDLALNDNKIRYALRVFRKEEGAPQPAIAFDANMGKEGESFAAGGAAADLPKCIVTGGAGTMTVSHDGKSYPICCSGCRDEFQENPAKYVARFLARQGAAPAAMKTAAATQNAEPKAGADEDAPGAPVPAPKEAKATPDKPDPEVRAKGVLAQGQSLEKAGKKQAAILYYKRIVKEYPDTEAARTARARIKALGG